jgi:ERCC4-related helicase
MKHLRFKPFRDLIQHMTTAGTRSRYLDNHVVSMTMEEGKIRAVAQGTGNYGISIDYNDEKVVRATCSCPYEQGGYCKHIVHVLVLADEKLENESVEQEILKINGYFVLERTHILELERRDIDRISLVYHRIGTARNTLTIISGEIGINELRLTLERGYQTEAECHIVQRNEDLLLQCSCGGSLSSFPCQHLNFALNEIVRTADYQLPFDTERRAFLLKRKADSLGLHNVEDPDSLFDIQLQNQRVFIQPKVKFLALDEQSQARLKQELLPAFRFPKTPGNAQKEFLVISESRFEERIRFQLMQAPLSKSGEIKAPVKAASLKEKLVRNTDPEAVKFYLALLQQDIREEDRSPDAETTEKLQFLKDILRNPFGLEMYLTEEVIYGGKVTPKSLQAITVVQADPSATIHVEQKNEFYVLTCTVDMENKTYQSKNLKTRGEFFIHAGDRLLFLQNEAVLRVLKFFRVNKDEVFLHQSQFQEFREDFLDRLEQSVTVSYSFVKAAPARVVRSQKLDQISEHLIYLSESDDFVLIMPVMRYGESEVPVLSRRTLYTEDPAGGLFSIERNEAAEQRFIKAVRQQHPFFAEQEANEFYYLQKRHFLDDGWFVEAFENWRSHGFVILGFNQLKNNRLNPHKMSVQTSVVSGIDWFDIHAKVKFGNQDVGLKEIQKSILNKSRYVELADGSQGILPEEWLEKFGHYFRSGELKDGKIRTHKTNFTLIDELFEDEVLSTEVRAEMEIYREKLAQFHSIRSVQVPAKLNATLRDYQKEGLNWLHFLNEFGFGGCLADDMGLGKTIQIIAYFLSLQEQGNTAPHLVVVPTSLLFNWQNELQKFAPSFRYAVIHNSSKEKVRRFENYDIVLTTYGTLLSEIETLKQFRFDCIVLDESQAVKNIGSKRYKAVRLLQGRQRLVLTGTPVENNTFDLYAQLSFANPGLLGSAKKFSDDYSMPIDKFQDSKRAKELQKKIHPFVLRRTKKQVAKELPEKTEMVVYCEMQSEQQRVYDTYKKEFQKLLKGMSDKEVGDSSLHILQGMTKLRQICNSPALLADDAFYGDQSAKLGELLHQIEDKKDDHKMLVFSQFVGMLELVRAELDKAGIGYAYLTGQTKDRQEQVELFQTDESIRVFLISLKAGGTGLNLTSADYVFVIDPWWNPAVENQAIDRAYRIGQEKKVVAVRLITPGTIEEKMLALQERKKDLAQDLVHTDTAVLKQLSREDLMNLV